MASKFDFVVAPLEYDYVFRGRSCTTSDKTVFDDAAALAREFAGVKETIEKRVMPVVTCVATGSASEDGTYQYFMGDQVEKKGSNGSFEKLLLPEGTLMVRVPVEFHTQAAAPLRAAEIRRAFTEDWLPTSGYVSAVQDLGFVDFELYHYRRRRFRRALKMVMELAFPVKLPDEPRE